MIGARADDGNRKQGPRSGIIMTSFNIAMWGTFGGAYTFIYSLSLHPQSFR